ncbi:7-cyano-7-deazaguanine synthase [Nocardioides terrisoli]|uniref:7-cyano-7-deazaguanine synthase n=1 Tax=Nocardioides terrisoli TaxID=3388267 RepID=UPI00287B713F|nr:7-cyano-7-deazaguanine synthase [Nocardioides marmorisolisilvae]
MTKAHHVNRNDDYILDLDGGVSALVSDLLSLCEQAFLADRNRPRGKDPDNPNWHRTLEIEVPVASVDLWSSAPALDQATELLTWLTDDDWQIQFVGVSRAQQATQRQLNIDPVERTVMLFSGGLDATAGAALLLPETPILGVGVVTNPVMGSYQRRAHAALTQLGDIRYSPVLFSVVSGGVSDNEPTRRTRGLVFLGVGVAAALQRGTRRLVVAENGIGALNLPLTGAQSGVMTSRAVHPKSLRLMAALISEVTGTEFVIDNPFLTSTKGQMVRALPPEAREACGHSQSCDNAAAGRGPLEKRCGHCTSCLLRRVSFHAAGRSDWDALPYLIDSDKREPRWRLPEVLWQAATFDAVLRSTEDSALLRQFPDLRHVLESELAHDNLRDLLATYVEEWRSFPDPNISRFLPQIDRGSVLA